MVTKLSAEKKDLSDKVQRLQISEGSLRDRVQRADEKIGELKSELSESKRTAEQVARKLKEKDTELARAILEHADAKKSLMSTVSTLENRLAQADEWGDKTTEKEDALAAAVADRLSLQAQVGDQQINPHHRER
jgi:chromosome segregation ATPase